MDFEFDPRKRDKTLAERDLDFARAGEVFGGVHITGQTTGRCIQRTDSSPWAIWISVWW